MRRVESSVSAWSIANDRNALVSVGLAKRSVLARGAEVSIRDAQRATDPLYNMEANAVARALAFFSAQQRPPFAAKQEAQ
jgi:hypothetical protein